MKTIIRLLLLCITAISVPGIAPVRANPAERVDNAQTICAEQTAAME
ncbi:MAG: hypothetical protein HYW28_07585, partial [Rhodospirillales bacterium]|nr:hypothetical protein [Rhodospirillales bacterium]